MTTNDEWVRERAAAVRGSAPWHDRSLVGPIEAALQDAIERGKAEQDKAVAAERERLLDRLRNPDEALVEAVEDAIYETDRLWLEGKRTSRAAIRALAKAISEGIR